MSGIGCTLLQVREIDDAHNICFLHIDFSLTRWAESFGPVKQYSSQSYDVWCLSMTFLKMVSGERNLWRLANERDSIFAAYAHSKSFHGFSELSEEFQVILESGLAIDPQQRHTAESIRKAIQATTRFYSPELKVLNPASDAHTALQLWPDPIYPTAPLSTTKSIMESGAGTFERSSSRASTSPEALTRKISFSRVSRPRDSSIKRSLLPRDHLQQLTPRIWCINKVSASYKSPGSLLSEAE